MTQKRGGELGRGEWLRQIRQRLQYGVPPLTHEECVRLYEYATGDTIEQRRRCPTCEGEGYRLTVSTLRVMDYIVQRGHEKRIEACPDCDRKGYTLVKTADF